MKEKDFLVYDVYYCNFLAYVGSGTKDRPQHVRSGSSHNKDLNEISLRSSVFGEPDVKVVVHKYFNTKEESLIAEKNRIKSKKPLFNKALCRSGNAKILSKPDKILIGKTNEVLLRNLERLEKIAEATGVNPNLIFTPFGFRCKLAYIRYDTECYDLVSLSMFGTCTALKGFCESYIDHNDNVVIKVLPHVFDEINDCLGGSRFVDHMTTIKENNKPLTMRVNYNSNYNGAEIPESCYNYMDDSVVLSRRLNTYRGIEIIVCLSRSKEESCRIYCLNNNQTLFETKDSSEALEIHRNMSLIHYQFTSYSNDTYVCEDFSLIGCMDFNKYK